MKTWESSCRIKKVLQTDPHGCGVACAAMVSGKSYQTVREIFARHGFAKKKHPFATNFHELRFCLNLLAVDSELKRWSGWDAVDNLGIVAVDTSMGSDHRNWHWVVAERHPEFGLVLHDPDFDLPSFSGRIPEGVLSHPFGAYEARKSWIKISQ